MIKVVLKPGKEEFVRRFHPWVFSGAIARIEGSPADGDLTAVFDRSGQQLAIGHFHHGSIAVRILTFLDENPAEAPFWVQKIEQAFAVRRTIGLVGDLETTCFRLVHGEGDHLPGLVVDVYGEVAVLQCHSIGMHRQREQIADALKAILGKHFTVYDKSAETLPAAYASKIQNGFLFGGERKAEVKNLVLENGLKFNVDVETGQKTGFFLDQRDNRLLLTKYARNRSVLNTFCYTGGFSLYALAAGAREVVSIDSSQKAIDLTLENVAANGSFEGSHEAQCADVQQFLKNTERQFDVVIVDPPAYAKSLEKRHNAVQGYKRLNEMAIQRTAPGGILFTFSCSQVVDRELFYHTITAAALEAGRSVRVLHHLTQGPDHPVNMFHPEGSYLKGLVLYVA